VQLKDESKYPNLFDESDDDDNEDTQNSSEYNPLAQSHKSAVSYHTESMYESSVYFNAYDNSSNSEDSINVDCILSNDLTQSFAMPFIVEKDVQFCSIPEIKPIISREGVRKTHKTASVASGARRTKKTDDQVIYLTKLYKRLGGKWDGRMRKEAMTATGLSRIQIYKWFFDRKLQEKSLKTKSKSQSGDSMEDTSDVEDCDSTELDNSQSQQLFTVEKIPVRQ
jgi:hypothetical protein